MIESRSIAAPAIIIKLILGESAGDKLARVNNNERTFCKLANGS